MKARSFETKNDNNGRLQADRADKRIWYTLFYDVRHATAGRLELGRVKVDQIRAEERLDSTPATQLRGLVSKHWGVMTQQQIDAARDAIIYNVNPALGSYETDKGYKNVGATLDLRILMPERVNNIEWYDDSLPAKPMSTTSEEESASFTKLPSAAKCLLASVPLSTPNIS